MLLTKLETPAFRICLGLGAALTLGLSSSTYGQDCGVGDVTSTEPCLETEEDDTINGGCNSTPAVFEAANVGGTINGTVSTRVFDGVDGRDTDWYLVTAAELAAADVDGNSIVRISHSGSSEAPVALFIVALGDTPCGEGEAVIIGTTGFAGPDCVDGDPSEAYIDINDHPHGIAYWIGTANPDGSGIFTGIECSTGNNDYVISMELEDLLWVSCAPGSGPCGAGNGTPGCDSPACCAAVCELDSVCCEEIWDEGCAGLAISIGCATQSCDVLATVIMDHIGPDEGGLGGTIYASQRFGSVNAAFNIVAAQPVVVPAPGFSLSCMEVVIDGYGPDPVPPFWPGNFDSVTAWSVEFYTSPEAAASNLIGDAGSASVVPKEILDFGGSFIAGFDLTTGPGAIELQPGTYYIGLIPSMIFNDANECCGQTGIRESTIGDDDSIQANPGGGFQMPGNWQETGSNMAYRLVGYELEGDPCPWDLDGSGAVSTGDLLILFSQWGTDGTADFDDSGLVGTGDLLILFVNWGPCP